MKKPNINLITKPNTSTANKTGAWRTRKPVIDPGVCISCGLCAKICPEGCIAMKMAAGAAKAKPAVDYDYCKGCGLCAHECPVKAIRMENDYK